MKKSTKMLLCPNGDGVALPRDQKRGKKVTFHHDENGVYFSLTKSTKSQKEESINSCLGDADTHAARMCQFLF